MIHDVSRYVTSGNVSRKIDQVSTAEIQLRNPQMMFTVHEDEDGNVTYPLFHPMDPITIWLRRVKGRPVRVFTGFLDSTPYLQLFPGTVTLKASCTLKRLLYTFFDPALPYTISFMEKYGWIMVNGSWISSAGLDNFSPGSGSEDAGKASAIDGSLSQLLMATMGFIGGWSPDDVYIEQIPDGLFTRLTRLATEFAADAEQSAKAFEEVLRQIVGPSSYGSASGGAGSGSAAGADLSGISGDVATQVYETGRKLNVTRKMLLAAMMVGIDETGMTNPSGGDSSSVGWRQELDTYGSVAERMNVPHSAERFYNEIFAYMKGNNSAAQGREGPYTSSMSAGQLADAVQRPGMDGRNNYLGLSGASKPNLRGMGEALLTKMETAYDKKYGGSGATDGGNAGAALADTTTRAVRRDGRTNKSIATTDTKIYAPIEGNVSYGRGWHESSVGVVGETTTSGHLHWHSGIDAGVPAGTPCIAPVDGEITMATLVWSDGGMVHFKFPDQVGDIKAGTIIGWGHIQKLYVKVGDKVKAGQHIADSGNPGGGPHVHFVLRTDGTDGGGDGNADPKALLEALQKGSTAPTSVTGGTTGSGADTSGDGTGSGDNIMASGTAGGFFASLDAPSLDDMVAAQLLSGDKSLMNDKPLLPFIQQMCQASLRHFQSLPDGRFYAFFPDYFGELGAHPPYWEIDDIEVLDGGVDISDDALVTHQYVVGDTANPLTGDDPFYLRAAVSSGVITIFNAFMSNSILNREPARKQDKANARDAEKTSTKSSSLKAKPVVKAADGSNGLDILLDRDEAAGFLERYGARPHVEDMPMIRSPYYEMFLAYQQFMLSWSRQFLTPFSFTFMPELFPGGKVGFPDHGLAMYIEEVTHTFDYVEGFTTEAALSAPSIYGDNPNNVLLPPNMVKALIEPSKPERQATRRATDAKRKKTSK